MRNSQTNPRRLSDTMSIHVPTYLAVLDDYADAYRHVPGERDQLPDLREPERVTQLCHLAYMDGQMRAFIEAGRGEKAMRWLCWMQGVLWSLGFLSLDNCRIDVYRILHDGQWPESDS